MWFWWRLTKIEATTRPDYLWPEIWSGLSKAPQQKESKNRLLKNQSSKTLEDWTAFTSSIQKMDSIRKPSKTQERNWKFPMGFAMPSKMGTKKRSNWLQDTASESTESNRKTKQACIVEVHESTRKRLESTVQITSRKKVQFDTPIYFGAQVYPDASSDENSTCESSNG